MQDYVDALLTVSIAVDIAYLVYWIVLNRKGHMSWIVYQHFLIGSAIELMLNWFGIIPEDVGLFFTGLGQFVYIYLLLIYAALIGIVNLILWLIDKRRNKNQI